MHGIVHSRSQGLIDFAYTFAARAHGSQKRKYTGEPYITHPVAVAKITMTADYCDCEMIAAAILHDVIEDYDVSSEEVENIFGLNVVRAVQLLSKDKENYSPEAYFNLISKCPIASLVKGGDRVHNVQTMHGVFSDEKKAQYISECENFILPMLKEARKRFPYQEPAYQNIKLVLLSQIELIKISLAR